MEYTTRELTDDEAKALADDLQEVLIKHNAEMGVISNIRLMKREEKTDGTDTTTTEETKEETNTTPEESGTSGGEEPS